MSTPLVFGQPRPRQLRPKPRNTADEHSLVMELPDVVTTSRWAGNPNPCIAAFGLGPEGQTCKTCQHLYRKTYSKTYIKCELRPDTNGAGTDHRAGWDACGKYAPSQTPVPVSPAEPTTDDDEEYDKSVPYWTR